MTTDFTSTIASSKKTASSDNLSSAFKAEFKKADGATAFDSLLSNASKSYVDKGSSNTSSFNSKDYAKNTKTTKDNGSSHTDAAKNTNAFAEQKDNRVNDKKTQNKNKTDKHENNAIDKNDVKNRKDDIKHTEDDKKTTESQKTDNIENKLQDMTQSKEAQQIAAQDSSKQTDDTKNANTSEVPQDNAIDAEITEMAEQTSAKNTLANEKLIANIEYIGEAAQELTGDNIACAKNPELMTQTDIETPIETKAQAPVETNGEKISEPGQDIVDRVIQNLKNSTNTNVSAVTGAVAEALPTDEALKQVLNETLNAQENTKQGAVSDTVTNSDIDVDVDAPQSQKVNTDTNSAPKTAKENLASDTSRFTVNIENATQETADDTAVLTPTSKTETAAKNTTAEPLIKITDEAAAQAKSNVETPVSKDFTASVKDKAAAQMTDLQGTNTIVTEVQNSTQNQTQSNTGQNNSSMQGNAAEQVVKLSLDNTSTSNISGSENFLGKLDAQLGASAKTAPQNTLLNKTDILSQMNAKFSEMQLGTQNKVSIILQPENLGKVSLEIMSSKDGIVAKMTTDNQQVKELFEKNVEALKTSLSSQGVSVNNIKVECTSESSNNAMNFEREQFDQGNQSNFSDSNGHNRQTHNSEQNAQSVYSHEYGSSEEAAEEMSNNVEIKNTDTKIRHNGKVDYTV